ncbi:MAG: right-handed parallel beta-helix repeat-containing protein, partial [Lentisphaeria bacterium]|nr:right-handed parallel beta-helix repeat-containing protein [Lentisphaeria bacterium]
MLKNDRTQPLIVLQKAKYIVLDKLTLEGGSHEAVIVNYSSNIRFTNCDISGWGRLNTKQDFETLGGKFGYITENGKLRSTNYSAGITLNYGDNILIEKCYIHDPAGHANSWRYSHPSGPCAIFAVCPTATTIRYNDLIANDLGRWNDAVEGLYNFNEDGGFNRDAEIYGNFMIFCQDDNIELDGGQQNVRCFGNRFEASYCGVSIQGCMSGPCYVFGNMFLNTGDQFGFHGQNIKTSTSGSG